MENQYLDIFVAGEVKPTARLRFVIRGDEKILQQLVSINVIEVDNAPSVQYEWRDVPIESESK